MIIVDLNQLITNPEYDFINNNEHLGKNIIFLTLGGSHAYGTSKPESDIDIRGCSLNSKSDLIGLSNFDQVDDSTTDTVIYSFNKLIKLISNCNPNTIELLGCKPEHYFRITPIGRELLNNRKMFLSKKAIYSFGGYANQQLRRLQNALARDNYPQIEKESHIMSSVKSAMMDFANRYTEFPEGSIKLHIAESPNPDLDAEIFVDANLEHYPLRDYKNMLSDMNNIIKDYDKLNKRNSKKDDLHLNKHAMHLVRLYLMCIDILEKEDIITYREKDHDLLMSIRNGQFQKEDGSFYTEFFDMITDLESKLDYAKSNTCLPENPNYKRIEDFVISVNEGVIKDAY